MARFPDGYELSKSSHGRRDSVYSRRSHQTDDSNDCRISGEKKTAKVWPYIEKIPTGTEMPGSSSEPGIF